MTELNCKFCQKECKNLNSYRNHQRLCPQNPDRVYKSQTLGLTSWNKGLTKEDPRVKAYGDSISKATKGRKGKKPSDEARKKMSDSRKKLLEERPELHPNRLLAGNRNKMTYPEKVAFEFLERNGVVFEHQKQIGKFFVDFCIGSTIIEIDGEQWHSSDEQKERDKKRDAVLAEAGYVVHRIWSKERIEARLDKIIQGVV